VDVGSTNNLNEGIKSFESVTPKKDSMSLDKEDFLKLFMESLKHQDPMSPMDNGAMMQQLSQLGQMEAVANLKLTVDEMKKAMLGSQIQQGSSLLGKEITAIDGQGSLVEGEAEELNINNGIIELLIGKKTIQIGQISKVGL
jgi:flagellar basal-body rod modification protein FlgD